MAGGPELAIYPNPAQSLLQVQHPASAQAYLEVFSSTGQRVLHLALTPGSSSTAVDVQGLPQGLYVLQYHSDAIVTVKQFMK